MVGASAVALGSGCDGESFSPPSFDLKKTPLDLGVRDLPPDDLPQPSFDLTTDDRSSHD